MGPKRLGPSVKPVDADSFPRVLEFALNAANLKPGDSGIGILLPNEWRDYSAAVDHACENFRYAAIYSDNDQASDAAAERILARFGLPIMTYKAAEFSKCRYPLLMDFTAGKLRLGRDLCIIGTDENGLPVRG